MTIEQRPIPHFSSRDSHVVENVILHWTVTSTLEAAFSALQTKGASYHYLVKDNVVWQLVNLEKAAWHAGNLDINKKSVGIALVGGPESPITPETLTTTAELAAQVLTRYGLSEDRVIGHRDVRSTQCPGTVDLPSMRTQIAALRTITLQAAPVQETPMSETYRSFTRDQLFETLYSYQVRIFKKDWPSEDDKRHAVDLWREKYGESAPEDCVTEIVAEQYKNELAGLSIQFEPITATLYRKVN